jgi:signal peptidase I
VTAERPEGEVDPAPSTERGTDAEAAQPPARRRPSKGFLAFFRELPGLLLLAFILALLIKTLLVQAFYIPSGSMEHTLDIGDRVLVNKVVYHIHDPRRGDVIVFSDPHPQPQPHRNVVTGFVHWLTDGLGLSRDPNKDFIKRVIGLPGDTVEVNKGILFVNGRRIPENYLGPAVSLSDYGPHRVPRNTLFVMGDNRGDSNDSRGTLGDIPVEKVIGRAFVIIWPPSRIGLLRRPVYPNIPAPAIIFGVPIALGSLVRHRSRTGCGGPNSSMRSNSSWPSSAFSPPRTPNSRLR